MITKATITLFFVLAVLLMGCEEMGPSGGYAPPLEPDYSMLSNEETVIVKYFNDIALGFESGNAERLTRKWRDTTRLYFETTFSDTLRYHAQRVIDEVNALTSNDFVLVVVDNPQAADIFVHFGTTEGFNAAHDEITVQVAYGHFWNRWDSNHNLTKGWVLVDTVRVPNLTEQIHLVREEMTQVLGFGRDSYEYDESIFQQNTTYTTEYAQIDREIIKLLYHPLMPTGITSLETPQVARRIFDAQLDSTSHP